MVRDGDYRMLVRAGRAALLAVLACAGCMLPATRVRTALHSPPAAPASEAAAAYALSSPDVVELQFPTRPELSGRYTVDPDGALAIPRVGRVAVAGLAPAAASERVAATAGIPIQRVRLAVAEYNSRLVFLFGPGATEERAVPYRGPETVVDFLHRMGGLTNRAKLDEVHVVRPHVAAGRRPEVFDVDLEAILVRGDSQSNILLEPYDQIYVGATRRSIWAHYLPGGDWKDRPPSP